MSLKCSDVPLWVIDQSIRGCFAKAPHALTVGCGKETLRYWMDYQQDGHIFTRMSRRQMGKVMRRAEEHGIVRRLTQPPAIAVYEVVDL